MVWTGPLLREPEPRADVLGNPHRPDVNGYCTCWDCPKWDGVEWWQPKRDAVETPIAEEVTSGPA